MSWDLTATPMRRKLFRGVLLLLTSLCGVVGASLYKDADRTGQVVAQGAVSWPQVALVRHGGGFRLPVHITHAGDGSGRLFVVEQEGRVRQLHAGVPVSLPLLDIAERVSCCGERGLLSVAFPPQFSQKRYFYVNYTDTRGDTVVARYFLAATSDRADPQSEEIILTVAQPFANHNGGQLAFGPDGFLYIGMGDGGGSGDPQNNAQNPATLLGKLLRIDVESARAPYAIPPTNPFVTTAGHRPEIWALGLRNPWRFAFDRQTGDLYIADVGQNAYEEVDFQPGTSKGGENYGWNIMEGTHCFRSRSCDQRGLVLPVAEYDHAQGCSITGGMVYRGRRFPRLQGLYFYADYCSGRLWGLRRDGSGWQTALLLDTPYAITSFGEDEGGELYLADYATGDIYLLIDAAPPGPRGVLENPQPRSFHSGIGVITGWVCTAARVDIEIDGVATFPAAYGTDRADTRAVCGDTDNGFGLLINWNLLGSGTHTVRAIADGTVVGEATVTVSTFGTEFVTGASGTYTLQDFPQQGRKTTIRWEESLQNFVIVGRE
ncbi:MAG: PQQ-dependent sugar dehydrogenase, partial [Candidatus Binatia bacterium]|nr:PQQ-dependent sugar dehydrogenase [Candidatus Binatia bacterium]